MHVHTPNDKFQEAYPPPGCGIEGAGPYKPPGVGDGMPILGLGMGIPDDIVNRKRKSNMHDTSQFWSN